MKNHLFHVLNRDNLLHCCHFRLQIDPLWFEPLVEQKVNWRCFEGFWKLWCTSILNSYAKINLWIPIYFCLMNEHWKHNLLNEHSRLLMEFSVHQKKSWTFRCHFCSLQLFTNHLLKQRAHGPFWQKTEPSGSEPTAPTLRLNTVEKHTLLILFGVLSLAHLHFSSVAECFCISHICNEIHHPTPHLVIIPVWFILLNVNTFSLVFNPAGM